MNLKYQQLVREEFVKELSTKTGWGRNDILSAFDRASSKASLTLLDEIAKTQQNI